MFRECGNENVMRSCKWGISNYIRQERPCRCFFIISFRSRLICMYFSVILSLSLSLIFTSHKHGILLLFISLFSRMAHVHH